MLEIIASAFPGKPLDSIFSRLAFNLAASTQPVTRCGRSLTEGMATLPMADGKASGNQTKSITLECTWIPPVGLGSKKTGPLVPLALPDLEESCAAGDAYSLVFSNSVCKLGGRWPVRGICMWPLACSIVFGVRRRAAVETALR
jgi:hypothetical protein